MPRQLPPLNAIRAFEAAGRHESFSRAAEELGVSHSAISKHVRGLEDRLGTQLFRDLPRGVALTQSGARYLSVLTPSFDAIAEATEEFAERAKGVVRVNGETVFVLKWLVPNLKSFKDQYPEIELEIDASPDFADIARYEADIAIRFYLSGEPDVATTLVSNASCYPYATPDICNEINGDPEKLFNYPLLRDRANDPWEDWFKFINRPDLRARLKPGKRMRAVLALESVLSGQGVMLASWDNVSGDVKAGRLEKCFEEGIQQGSYHMLFGEGVLRRKPVRLFRDWLLEETVEFRSADVL